jgi:putative DNA primase/helicase
MNESQLSQSDKIQLFKSLFRGRDDCYGEGGDSCTKENLTDTVIKNHLSGKKRIGVYLLVSENGNQLKNLIHFAVMDFDNPDDAPKESSRLDDALDYINVCKSYGLNACLEKSKTDGSFHVWHFFSEAISALKIRRLMMQIVSDANIKRYEIFPKQDSTESFGNYVNLPLFKTNLPTNTAFLDDLNQPYTDQWSYIQQIAQSIKNSPENIDDIIEINNINLSNNGNKTQSSEEPKEKWLSNALDGVSDGKRTTTLVKLVGYWASKNMPNDVIMSTAIMWDKGNKPPLIETDGRELFTKTVIDVINRYHNGGVLNEPDNEPPIATKVKHEEKKIIEGLMRTDYGNAERLVYYFGDVIRYCHPMKSWFIWDGKRWKEDTNAQISRFAKDTVRKIYIEAGLEPSEEKRGKINKHAAASESSSKIQAMISLAQSELSVSIEPNQLDANLMLLNCLNGTLDLRTGDLAHHKKSDLITKLIPVNYDYNAKLDVWDDFLHTVTNGDLVLQQFLQQAVGYSLTGSVAEEKLFFISGPAGSGKSTFIESIKSILTEYSKTADFESFVTHTFTGGTRNDIAALAGARFVSSIEVDKGKRLAEGLVKLITGGDTVTARFLYQEAFSFIPQFKLWLVANDKPEINADDDGMWRRIVPINFDHVIPEDERDPKVKETLKDPSISGPAILAWAVKGCLLWQENGLHMPDSIKVNRSDYKNEMDTVKQFVDEFCELDETEVTTKQMLFSQYQQWCKNSGIDHLSKIMFGKRLKNTFPTIKDDDGTKHIKLWAGIKISSFATINNQNEDLLSNSY